MVHGGDLTWISHGKKINGWRRKRSSTNPPTTTGRTRVSLRPLARAHARNARTYAANGTKGKEANDIAHIFQLAIIVLYCSQFDSLTYQCQV